MRAARRSASASRARLRRMDEYLPPSVNAEAARGQRRSGQSRRRRSSRRGRSTRRRTSPWESRERLIMERGETFALSTIDDFYRRDHITLKKDGARQRASARGCSRTPRRLFDLQPSSTRRSCLHRRDRGHHARWPGCAAQPRGERCRAAVPHGHWKTTTLSRPAPGGLWHHDVDGR